MELYQVVGHFFNSNDPCMSPKFMISNKSEKMPSIYSFLLFGLSLLDMI